MNLGSLIDGWRRRWWRPEPQALAAFEGLRPVTLVTGGSEGIGYALARQFAARGHSLLLVARRSGPLEEAARRIRADFRGEVSILPQNVTDPGAIGAIESTLATLNAYVDVLINSAGMGLAGRFHDEPEEKLQRLLDLNIAALTRLTRHFIAGMRVRGRGGILNLASLGSYVPGPNQAAYYASKAYVMSLTEAIAAEVSGEGVRVCALAPGPVRTAFHRRMGSEHAGYRYLVPPASPDAVARAGYLGFVLGLRVMVPGLLTPFMALALRILPHRIMIPIIGWLLQPRG